MRRPDQRWNPPPPSTVSPGGHTGIFRGRLVVVNAVGPPAGGIFLYDATGELVGSWVSIAGTDPLEGESVSIGLTVQNASATETCVLSGGNLTITKLSGILAPPGITLADNTQSAPFNNMSMNAAGITVDTWNAIPLAVGFTGVAGFATPSYRMNGVGDVRLAGAVTGTIAGATAFSTALPSAYFSGTNNFEAAIPVQASGGTSAGVTPRCKLTTGGLLQILGLANGAATWNLDGIIFPVSIG